MRRVINILRNKDRVFKLNISDGSLVLSDREKKHILRVMEGSGWGAYEAFCVMYKISQTQKTGFQKIAKERKWEEYRNERALKQFEGRKLENPKAVIDEDIFYDAFYTAKQKKAIDDLKNRMITARTICDFFDINLPEEIMKAEGDLSKRIKFSIQTVRQGDIFISPDEKAVTSVKVKERKPACVISYRSYMEKIDYKNIEYIPCAHLNSLILDFVKFWLDSYSKTTVAITGSVGKTSTTDMIGEVVLASKKMHKVTGNRNTTWQIADFALRLKDDDDVFVQECSGSLPGQMEKTSRMITPDIFVLTNIGNGHIGRYEGKQERLMYEKLGLDRHAMENACGLVNWDDKILKRVKYSHKVEGFAIEDKTADYFAENIVEKDGTVQFDVIEKSGISTHILVNVIGRHNVYNALAAFAVGVKLGIDRKDIAEAIAKYDTNGARQNLVTYGGQKLYIDCCSATEESMKSAVAAMSTITVPAGNRKIAVLADVQALGDQSEEVHRRIGKMVGELGTADEVFFYGSEMKYAMDEALKSGVKCKNTDNREELESWLINETAENDLIAIKAGHIMGCQWIVDDIYGTNLYLHDKFAQNEPVVKEKDKSYKCIKGYGCAVVKVNKKAIRDEIEGEAAGYPVRIIDNGVYKNAAIEEISVSAPVSCIAERAFAGCENLMKIEFPDSLKYIGENAFEGCENLERVDLSRGCMTIDKGAFRGCSSLKEILLPDSIKTIHEDAFDTDAEITVICNPDSYAGKWAKENGYNIVGR